VLSNIRRRFDRKKLAVLAVLAIALSGTGLASLAQLQDNVSATVNASITTIDVNINGVKNATINLPSGLIPGDHAYASLAISNSGSGYAKLPNSGAANNGGASEFLADSVKKVWFNISPAQCNAIDLPWAAGGTETAAFSQLWDNEPQVDAGTTLNVCVIYRLGTTSASYTDGVSNWSLTYPITAYYP
jgi:hypothetical protein